MTGAAFLRYFCAHFQGTSKNTPFAIWTDLLPQLFIMKSPRYTKYSELSITQFVPKSLAQIIKKAFLKDAFS